MPSTTWLSVALALVTDTLLVACHYRVSTSGPIWFTAVANVLTTPKVLIASNAKTFITIYRGDPLSVVKLTLVSVVIVTITLIGAISTRLFMKLPDAFPVVSVTIANTIPWAAIVNNAKLSSIR